MNPGDPVIVENRRLPALSDRGTLIAENVWEGDEQWTYVQLDDGTKIAVEPWRVKPDHDPRAKESPE